jgi:hypothetical protein
MKFQPSHQVVGRRAPKRVPCEGARSKARYRISEERGICPACGQEQPVYDSSRVGHGLLVDHLRDPSHASVEAS